MRAEEIVLSTPDGRSITTLVNATPIHADDGAVASVVVTMQDLAPLQELERHRAEFLAMVSHELRMPLTSIKGSTAALLGASRQFAPAETREFIRIVDGQADRMIGLVSELLDAGRIDTGTLSVSPESSEVAALVDRARTTFLSGGGRHTVLIDLPPDLPRVMADRQRVEQVLSNLLANAARQAPESSPIRVAAERDGVHVAVSVADEGRGIPPERLAQLFRKYSAGPGGEPGAGTAGSGLGLAICRRLVEAHGGRIRAESGGPGRGARFTFTLLVAGDAVAGASGAAPDRPAPRQGREPDAILVVDDDPQTLRYVRDTLAEAGFSPLVTGDHGELAAIIRAENPALVLLDLMLPGTDGIELMETVPELAGLPVIFISGYGRDETIARALAAGAEDYIVKPFSPTELTARIRAVLRRRADPARFVLGILAIDYDRRRVTVAGREVELTATEYELLRALSLNAGRVTTSETLLNRVWPGRSNGDTKVVRAFVKQLRRKLGDDAASPAWIFNERGVGCSRSRTTLSRARRAGDGSFAAAPGACPSSSPSMRASHASIWPCSRSWRANACCRANRCSPRQLPRRLAAMVVSSALQRPSRNFASAAPSRSPATMARTINCPVLPMMSLSTLSNCTFICPSAFCMCCTARLRSRMSCPRWRTYERIGHSASGDRNAPRNSP